MLWAEKKAKMTCFSYSPDGGNDPKLVQRIVLRM